MAEEEGLGQVEWLLQRLRGSLLQVFRAGYLWSYFSSVRLVSLS